MTTKEDDAPHGSLREAMLLDHRRLERMFAPLCSAFEADAAEAATLWTQLDAALERHFQMEEREIFPALARRNAHEAEGLASEHADIRRQLLVLGVGVDLHITRLEVVRALVRKLRAHAAREDALLYRWAEQHLDEHKRVTLRTRLLVGLPGSQYPR